MFCFFSCKKAIIPTAEKLKQWTWCLMCKCHEIQRKRSWVGSWWTSWERNMCAAEGAVKRARSCAICHAHGSTYFASWGAPADLRMRASEFERTPAVVLHTPVTHQTPHTHLQRPLTWVGISYWFHHSEKLRWIAILTHLSELQPHLVDQNSL